MPFGFNTFLFFLGGHSWGVIQNNLMPSLGGREEMS